MSCDFKFYSVGYMLLSCQLGWRCSLAQGSWWLNHWI